MLEDGLWMIGGRKTWPEVERKEVLDGVWKVLVVAMESYYVAG